MPPIYTGPTKVSLPGIDKVYYGPDLVYKKDHADYLTFTALASGSTIYLANSSNTPNCEYSFDGGEHWNTFPTSTSSKITLSDVGQSIIVRGDNPTGFSTGSTHWSRFVMSGSIGASGSVMSLIDGTGETDTIPADYCFCRLFYNSSSNSILKSAPEFPATVLTEHCYQETFYYCQGMTTGPSEFPAESVPAYAYNKTFTYSRCKVPPIIRATYLANYSMFGTFTSDTALKAGYSSTYTGGTLFFTCPPDSSGAFSNTFAGTGGQTSTPTAGQAWYYI